MNSKNALLVDDDPVVLMLVSQYLINLGFSVKKALSLYEAERVVETAAPSVILLDLFLSDGDNTSFLEFLSSGDVVAPPVVIMTSHDDVAGIIGDSGHYAGVLRKPFSQSELLVCLSDLGFVCS